MVDTQVAKAISKKPNTLTSAHKHIQRERRQRSACCRGWKIGRLSVGILVAQWQMYTYMYTYTYNTHTEKLCV